MWFKLTYSLAGMFTAQAIDAPVSIPVPSDGKGDIVLWLRTFETQTGIPPQLCCDAVIQRDIKPDVAAMFDSLSKRILPRDESSKIDLPYHLSFDAVIDSDGNIPDKWIIPLTIMPTKFQDVSRNIHDSLADLARNLIRTLRWRQGASGPHSPFSLVGFMWSKDKISWTTMPSTTYARAEVLKGIDISPEAINDLKTILLSDEEEPLGHELIREAFDIAGTSPRSALLIGVSALETALKNYVSVRVPHSYIILERVPSPPVITIIQEVIPRIHKSLGSADSVFPLKEGDIRILRKWIEQRNRVAHGAKREVNVDELLGFLSFVRTLLYKIDTCRGQAWAESLI